MENKKKNVFSGIQPTGIPTLGNYLGAMRGWPLLQKEYNCIYSVVDLHSLTVRQEPAKLRRQTLSLVALLLAIGIDPEQSPLFIQSHVHTHAELAWLLNCYTQFGELSRMTQFKDKSVKHPDNINAGLFCYPVLMAADILLYQTDLVPVGADQKQHLELARDIASRFNGLYGDVFRQPEPYIPPSGARVMSLQDPTKKMSKSDTNPNGYVLLLDDTDTILRKFRRAVTDSGSEIISTPDKPGVSNLMAIYSVVTGKTTEEIEKDFDGKGYGAFKTAVGEAVAETLRPVREKYNDLFKNKDYLQKIYTEGAEKALQISQRTYLKACKKLGLVLPQ
ncbi:MAG TPA: tryptophan--tRNA ligase [Ruminococcaceae bacterium]|nr:tryptophan--tRNA ligase [Oscillospiraceae bacterium]